MTKVNIHEAKTHLSRYIHSVEEGETLVLCRNDVPVALITPLPKPRKRKLYGSARGMVRITPAFFEELTDKELPGMGLS